MSQKYIKKLHYATRRIFGIWEVPNPFYSVVTFDWSKPLRVIIEDNERDAVQNKKYNDRRKYIDYIANVTEIHEESVWQEHQYLES